MTSSMDSLNPPDLTRWVHSTRFNIYVSRSLWHQPFIKSLKHFLPKWNCYIEHFLSRLYFISISFAKATREKCLLSKFLYNDMRNLYQDYKTKELRNVFETSLFKTEITKGEGQLTIIETHELITKMDLKVNSLKSLLMMILIYEEIIKITQNPRLLAMYNIPFFEIEVVDINEQADTTQRFWGKLQANKKRKMDYSQLKKDITAMRYLHIFNEVKEDLKKDVNDCVEELETLYLKDGMTAKISENALSDKEVFKIDVGSIEVLFERDMKEICSSIKKLDDRQLCFIEILSLELICSSLCPATTKLTGCAKRTFSTKEFEKACTSFRHHKKSLKCQYCRNSSG